MQPHSIIARLALLSFLPIVASAADVTIGAEIRLGRALPPPPPEIVVVESVGPKGPPPWAPAHGFRRNREYYYYPDAMVYFRPADRTWYFRDGDNWRTSAELPASVRIDFGRSVPVTMETDRPFEHHANVAKFYPGDYFTKVKIKEKGSASKSGKSRGPAEPPARQPPGGPPADGKGKGKGKGN